MLNENLGVSRSEVGPEHFLWCSIDPRQRETLHFFHSTGETDCRLSLQSRNPCSWKGFRIILLKDTTAEKKLIVVLGSILSLCWEMVLQVTILLVPLEFFAFYPVSVCLFSVILHNKKVYTTWNKEKDKTQCSMSLGYFCKFQIKVFN